MYIKPAPVWTSFVGISCVLNIAQKLKYYETKMLQLLLFSVAFITTWYSDRTNYTKLIYIICKEVFCVVEFKIFAELTKNDRISLQRKCRSDVYTD